MKGFIEFIRTQGVLGLAVGFILGRAVSDLVASLVADIINPLVGLLLGRFSDLADLSLTIGTATIAYGKFAAIFINFLIVAFVVYFGVTKLKLNKLDKPKA